jgi:deoxyribonuclease V
MKPLHAWDVDVESAKRIQETLRSRVTRENGFSKAATVGGADVSYAGDNSLLAVVLIFSYPDLKLLDSSSAAGKTSFPYVPGLLAFREGPILIKAWEKLKLKPDVMIFEGQGIAHPRGLGMASHLGLWLDVPSVGCTKTPLLRTEITVGASRGKHQPVLREGVEVGAIVRTKTNVKPVFVSPGHRVDLPTSIRVILETCRDVRMPEPLRRADHVSRALLHRALLRQGSGGQA